MNGDRRAGGPEGALSTVGLMSGTSLDGVDAALIVTDGETIAEIGPWLTRPYDDELRDALRAAIEGAHVARAERALTLAHTAAVAALLTEAGLAANEVDLIGFPGQTLIHRPGEGLTWQIGDGALLAETTGIDVITDFRRRDVEAGGQGAPFAPLYHRALAGDIARPLAVLNLGGVANVTWIGDGEALLAFDTGPGCAMIDDWAVRHIARRSDKDGALARAGSVDEVALAVLMADPYFAKTPPKSLDRNAFDAKPIESLGAADGAATLTAFTARGVVAGAGHFAAPVRRWLVSGGGRHNPALMDALRASLDAPVEPVEAVGWQGDALEAQAFGYLAVRALRARPLSLPETTGVPRPVTGGTLHRHRTAS